MLHPAALAQALLFATQPAAQVARYRRLGVGVLVVSCMPQTARKNVGYTVSQPKFVGHVDQHLVEWAVSGDASQLHQGGACPPRSEPPEKLDQALLGGVRAHQGRTEEHTSELQSLAYLVCRLLLE